MGLIAETDSFLDTLINSAKEIIGGVVPTIIEQGKIEIRDKIADTGSINVGRAGEDSDLINRDAATHAQLFGLSKNEVFIIGGGAAAFIVGIIAIGLITRK